MAAFSIREEFRGATVLLTGGSGYVGSVVLEQLLRCTDVHTVYCLLRPKRGQDPQQRLDRLLDSTLFQKVRETSAIKRAQPVSGDIMSAKLGLSDVDRATIESHVDVIIHCAADIALEADIQTTLRANVEGVRAVVALARRCSRLRAMAHTSSAYVNTNMPTGSMVQERIYPLLHGGREINAEEVVQELLQMDNAAANMRAKGYLARWNFPNTYTFGKNLGEKVLAAEHARAPLPLAIVRPSLVCCVALEPLPGYCGNLAGPNGLCAALAAGLYDSLEALPFQPRHTWDFMAADYVGHTILAAAAAVSAGAASSGGASAQTHGDQHGKDTSCCKDVNISSGSSSGASELPALRPPAIYHATLGSNNFLTFREIYAYWQSVLEQHPPPYRLAWGLPRELPFDFEPSAAAVEARLQWTGMKVAAAVLLLDLTGMTSAAKMLRNMFTAFETLNNDKLDRNLTFDTFNTVALAARLRYEDAVTFPVVWKALGTAHDPCGAAEEPLNMATFVRLVAAGVYQRLYGIKINV